MIRVKFRKDLSGLDRLERRVPQNASASVEAAARALAYDIRTSWSPRSPSMPYTPPAIDTGKLDSSVRVRTRDALGRFSGSGKNATSAAVEISATYARFLEEGTSKMRERPFIEPAVQRLEGVYAEFFRGIFK